MPIHTIGRVIGIEECGDYEVFDMTLRGAHNFFASNVNVHNCSEPKII